MKMVINKFQKGTAMGVKLDVSSQDVTRTSNVQSTDNEVKEDGSDEAFSDTESVGSSASHGSCTSDPSGSKQDLKLPRINE